MVGSAKYKQSKTVLNLVLQGQFDYSVYPFMKIKMTVLFCFFFRHEKLVNEDLIKNVFSKNYMEHF